MVDYVLNNNQRLNFLEKWDLNEFWAKWPKIRFLKNISRPIVEWKINQFLLQKRQKKRYEWMGLRYFKEFVAKWPAFKNQIPQCYLALWIYRFRVITYLCIERIFDSRPTIGHSYPKIAIDFKSYYLTNKFAHWRKSL